MSKSIPTLTPDLWVLELTSFSHTTGHLTDPVCWASVWLHVLLTTWPLVLFSILTALRVTLPTVLVSHGPLCCQRPFMLPYVSQFLCWVGSAFCSLTLSVRPGDLLSLEPPLICAFVSLFLQALS